jgi:hypothetical protein
MELSAWVVVAGLNVSSDVDDVGIFSLALFPIRTAQWVRIIISFLDFNIHWVG